MIIVILSGVNSNNIGLRTHAAYQTPTRDGVRKLRRGKLPKKDWLKDFREDSDDDEAPSSLPTDSPPPPPSPSTDGTLRPPSTMTDPTEPSDPEPEFCNDQGDLCWVQDGRTLWSEAQGSGFVDGFGTYLSISNDGNRLAVSAPRFNQEGMERVGMVRVYDYEDGSWVPVGEEIIGKNPNDGIVGVLSGNGQRIAVMNQIFGDFDFSTTSKIQVYDVSITGKHIPVGTKLPRDSSYWEFLPALNEAGNVLIIGVPQIDSGGYLQVYEYIDTTGANGWSTIGQEIRGNAELDERLGLNVAISADATVIATSSFFGNYAGDAVGIARFFDFENGLWVESGQVRGDGTYSYLGKKLALSADGSVMAVSSIRQNLPGVSVHLLDEGGIQLGQVVFTSDFYETSIGIALSEDGRRIAVGRQFYGVGGNEAEN